MESTGWLCDDETWGQSDDKQTWPSRRSRALSLRENPLPNPPLPSPPRLNSLTLAQRKWEDRKERLTWQYGASRPRRFFFVQVEDELEWLDANQLLEQSGTDPVLPRGPDLKELARKRVLANWMKWGLQEETWGDEPTFAPDQWMYEKGYPHDPSPGPFGGQPTARKGIKPEQARPFYQFLAHVSLERSRISKEARSRPTHPWHRRDYEVEDYNARLAQWEVDKKAYEARRQGGDDSPANINTIAYDRVKTRWKQWGVWNDSWGVLPGMWWQHERPLKDFLQAHMLGKYPEPDAGEPSKGPSEDSIPGPRSFDSTASKTTTVEPKHEQSVSPHSPPQEAFPQVSPAENCPVLRQGTRLSVSTPHKPGEPLPLYSISLPFPPENCPDQDEHESPVPSPRGQQSARSSSPGSDADVSGPSSSALGPIRPDRVSKTAHSHQRPSKALETAAAVGLLAPKLEILDESQVPDSPRRSNGLLAGVEKEGVNEEEE